MTSFEGVVAAEIASSAQRWELPLLSFGEKVSKAPPPPTAEQLERIEHAAYEEGYARGRSEGHADGRKAGMAEVRTEAQRLRDLFDHVSRPLAEIDAEVERTLVALTIEVARRLVDHHLQLDPELTAHSVREAVASLATPPREARVHLNPEDVAVLEAALPAPSDVHSWRLVADKQLRRGDCRLVTESGQVDSLLDTRQAAIARGLLGEGE